MSVNVVATLISKWRHFKCCQKLPSTQNGSQHSPHQPIHRCIRTGSCCNSEEGIRSDLSKKEVTLIDIYRVSQLPSELKLGFVDLDFEYSTVCPTLLGLMEI